MSRPLISVIVPTLNREFEVRRFLNSLRQQEYRPIQCIIVDASKDDVRWTAKEVLGPDIELIWVKCNPGLTIQRNFGLQHATGKYIFYFDDDIVLEQHFFDPIVDEFESPANTSVGVIYGTITNNAPRVFTKLHQRIHYSVGKAIAYCFMLPRHGNGKFQLSGMPTFVIGDSEQKFTECMPGGLTGYRRSVFDTFRFDERLSTYSYMEDDDTGYRISRIWKILYTPRARCQHLHTPNARLKHDVLGKMLMVNHHYLFIKNFPKDLPHRFAHIISLLGYPLSLLWALNIPRFRGSIVGLWSCLTGRDPLFRQVLHP